METQFSFMSRGTKDDFWWIVGTSERASWNSNDTGAACADGFYKEKARTEYSEEIEQIVSAAIEEINHGSITSLDELINRRL